MKSNGRSGFTVVEMMVSLGISSLLLYTIVMALGTSVGTYRTSSTSMDLERQGGAAMRRIVEAIRGSDIDFLAAVPAPPFSAPTLLFQDYERFDGTIADLSPLRTISLVNGAVVWTESPGTADEVITTWASGVPAFLEGETFDGTDENGNLLRDETGLCFSREGDTVVVRLTLQSADLTQTRTWTSRVACRN